MSRFAQSLPPSYFDDLYAADADPWRFASSGYERDKYAATLAALPRERYGAALEVGCSIGVFTHQLAARCDGLLALDLAPLALDEARARCAGQPAVRFERRVVPADWPTGRFDLIVLSEVVYYLDRPDIVHLAARTREALMPEADVILVHWLGDTHYPLTGDEAADAFIAETVDDLVVVRQDREAAYRLDILAARR